VRGGAHTTITITAAGDAVLGGDQRSGKVVANPRSYQAFKAVTDTLTLEGKESLVFWNVKNFFGGDTNVSTFNLEGTLTLKDTRDDKKPFVFQGRPEWARTIVKAAGIDAVNMANNHAYDVGKDGYEGTIRALSKPDLRVGYYGNGHTDYVTKNGVKVAFLGYVSRNAYITRMRSEIQSAAKKADIVGARPLDDNEFQDAMPSTDSSIWRRPRDQLRADLSSRHTHPLSASSATRQVHRLRAGQLLPMAIQPRNTVGPTTIRQVRLHSISTATFIGLGCWSPTVTIIPPITSQYNKLSNDAHPPLHPTQRNINR
jgi:hypothetical protein